LPPSHDIIFPSGAADISVRDFLKASQNLTWNKEVNFPRKCYEMRNFRNYNVNTSFAYPSERCACTNHSYGKNSITEEEKRKDVSFHPARL